MKIHALVLAAGLVGAAAVAQAQTALPPADPLTDLQNVFGQVVDANFKATYPIIFAKDPNSPAELGKPLGAALKTGLDIPGAAFAGIVKPFADASNGGESPAPPAAAAAVPRKHGQARTHRRAPAQG